MPCRMFYFSCQWHRCNCSCSRGSLSGCYRIFQRKTCSPRKWRLRSGILRPSHHTPCTVGSLAGRCCWLAPDWACCGLPEAGAPRISWRLLAGTDRDQLKASRLSWGSRWAEHGRCDWARWVKMTHLGPARQPAVNLDQSVTSWSLVSGLHSGHRDHCWDHCTAARRSVGRGRSLESLRRDWRLSTLAESHNWILLNFYSVSAEFPRKSYQTNYLHLYGRRW